jgi:hypothetical protein
LAKRTTSKRKIDQPDFLTSLKNLLLNTLIFTLSVLVIYLLYSIFMKLSSPEEIEVRKFDNSVPSDIIQVEILNGCGVSKIGERFRDFLRSKGFDVVNVDNYIKFDVNETLVIDRVGNIANAKLVATTLGMPSSKAFPQLNSDYFVDVTVVIGKDFNKLNPIKLKE